MYAFAHTYYAFVSAGHSPHSLPSLRQRNYHYRLGYSFLLGNDLLLLLLPFIDIIKWIINVFVIDNVFYGDTFSPSIDRSSQSSQDDRWPSCREWWWRRRLERCQHSTLLLDFFSTKRYIFVYLICRHITMWIGEKKRGFFYCWPFRKNPLDSCLVSMMMMQENMREDHFLRFLNSYCFLPFFSPFIMIILLFPLAVIIYYAVHDSKKSWAIFPLFANSNLVIHPFFFSFSSLGLNGIELGMQMIREVTQRISDEFPNITQFSTLSPIPGFRDHLLTEIERVQQGKQVLINNFFREEELLELEDWLFEQVELKAVNVWDFICDVVKTNSWIHDEYLSNRLKIPMMRKCAHYLYSVKEEKGYAINSVGKCFSNKPSNPLFTRVPWSSLQTVSSLNVLSSSTLSFFLSVFHNFPHTCMYKFAKTVTFSFRI